MLFRQAEEKDAFDHVVVNDDVERAVDELERIVDSVAGAAPTRR